MRCAFHNVMLCLFVSTKVLPKLLFSLNRSHPQDGQAAVARVKQVDHFAAIEVG